MNVNRKTVEVVAGVLYNAAGAFLLSSRPEGKPYAGYWEFAGGKVEAGETELAALQREFREELGIAVQHATPWLVKIHDYEHARVRLHFYRIADTQWQGQLQAREGQTWHWQHAGRLTVGPMLPANDPVLAALTIPTRLSGNLQNGFTGINDSGQVFRVQLHTQASQSCNAVLVPFSARHTIDCEAVHQPVWVLLNHCEQWHLVQDMAAAVWPVCNDDDVAALERRLQQGCGIPLLALVDGKTLAKYGRLWLKLGIHGVITTENTCRE